MKVLEFIFSSFWVFIGFAYLFTTAVHYGVNGIIRIFESFRKKS